MNKKSIRKTLLISLILIIAVFSSVSAATEDIWGPNWYTPYRAITTVDSTYVAGTNMKWSQSSINTYNSTHYWELEFRPNTGHPDDYWGGVSSFTSEMPSAYYEYETGTGSGANDVTIASHGMTSLVADRAYAAVLWLYEKSGNALSYTIESEYGTWLLFDGIPSNYEVRDRQAVEGSPVTW